MINVLWCLFFLSFPALILWACGKYPWLDKVGGIVICYAIGILIGNIGILPAGIFSVQDILITIVIPLALPLIFFSMDLHGFRKQTGVVIKALAGAMLSVVLATGISFLIFRNEAGEEGWKVAGMLVGVYTGGTPNMAAVGNALDMSADRYAAVHGSDVLVSGILFFLIISIIPRVLRKWLPVPFRETSVPDESDPVMNFQMHFTGFKREYIKPLVGAFGLSVLIFAIGGGVSFLVPQNVSSVIAILLITTLGIAASFVPRIRQIKMTFQTGFYLLMVFSLVVSSMANIRVLSATAPMIILYVAVMLLISMILHILFSKILKVDAHTHIIVSTSMIYSPPFVPVVAAALKDKSVIMAGMLTGIVGWILGNYLGIGLGYLLRWLGGLIIV